MKLNQFVGDVITTSVRNQMMLKCFLLQFVEFYSIVGNADYSRKKSTATGGQFRAVNADYVNDPTDPTFANPTLKIFGDLVKTDRAHERRGSDIASVRTTDLLNFAGQLGKQFGKYFINGDSEVDAKQFNGLKKIMPAGQISTPAVNGISVPLGNSDSAKSAQQKFLEYLDNLIGSIDGGAEALILDATVISRLTRIAEGNINRSLDDFGRPVTKYGDTILIPSGFDNAGGKVITQTETCGTSNDCTSIYAVRFGEAENLSMATNTGVDVKDLQLVGVHWTYSVDFDLDTALLNDKAIGRMQGIRLP